jgi:prephenate dehydratase
MELGYLGPQGSHSHEAAKVYAPAAKLVPMTSFYEIIQAVEKGDIDRGILPIENSTEGAVTFVMDALLDYCAGYVPNIFKNPVMFSISHNASFTALFFGVPIKSI